jgi:hypothetical protein
LKQKFSRINEVSGKAGIFLGPQIREIMRDSVFDSSSSEVEGESWKGFKAVTTNFLRCFKAHAYESLIERLNASIIIA